MKPKFSVIKGGLDIPKIENGRTFVSGSATDTRLMGVIGLELTWDVLRDSRIEKMHQIFYLDCEEYGIESYTEGYGDMPADILEERFAEKLMTVRFPGGLDAVSAKCFWRHIRKKLTSAHVRPEIRCDDIIVRNARMFKQP